MKDALAKLVRWIVFGDREVDDDESFPDNLEMHDEIIDRMKMVYEHTKESDPVTLRVRGRRPSRMKERGR